MRSYFWRSDGPKITQEVGTTFLLGQEMAMKATWIEQEEGPHNAGSHGVRAVPTSSPHL